MHPILIDFGTRSLPFLGDTRLFLPTYGVLLAVAVGLAWVWFHGRALSLGVDRENAFNLAFYSLIGGLVGAKVSLVVVDWRWYLEDPARILSTIRSAGVLMGGVASGIVAFLAYARRKGLPILRLGDAIAAPLALGQAVGRLGCFSAGCCYGVAAPEAWCAVTFRSAEAAARTGVPLGIPLLPVQLFQAGADLAVAGILTRLWRRSIRPGLVFAWYLVLYGASRFTIEFFRGDEARGLWFSDSLSTSQVLSLASIACGAAWLVAARGRRPDDAR
jgi:phosphatidylglycerol:prolipoprotein diacylglycerol transferase